MQGMKHLRKHWRRVALALLVLLVFASIAVLASKPNCNHSDLCSSDSSNASVLVQQVRSLRADLITYRQENAYLAEQVRYARLCSKYIFPRCTTHTRTIEGAACTGSMRPAFSCKDEMNFFRPGPDYEVKLCDVIFFDTPEKVLSSDDYNQTIGLYALVHRVVGFNGSRFVTKGDANLAVDGYQPKSRDVRWVMCRN